jgi:hypothetical protein
MKGVMITLKSRMTHRYSVTIQQNPSISLLLLLTMRGSDYPQADTAIIHNLTICPLLTGVKVGQPCLVNTLPRITCSTTKSCFSAKRRCTLLRSWLLLFSHIQIFLKERYFNPLTIAGDLAHVNHLLLFQCLKFRQKILCSYPLQGDILRCSLENN